MEYLFVFITGAVIGWFIEVVFRRYWGKARRWINPGFLSGPYLPLYGTGVVVLYMVSGIQIDFWIKVIIFAVVTTLIEYLTGLFFLRVYKTRLWDYTESKFNIEGIITPTFTLFWTILSLVFYFVLYPYIYTQVTFLYENLELSLFIGMAYGIMVVDMIYAFNLLNRLKKMADSLGDSKIAINYELLKEEILERFEELSGEISEKVEQATDKAEAVKEKVGAVAEKVGNVTERVGSVAGKVSSVSERLEHVKDIRIKPSFLLPFRGDYNLKEEVALHMDKLRRKR